MYGHRGFSFVLNGEVSEVPDLRHATARAPGSSASASAVRRFAGTSRGALTDVGEWEGKSKGHPMDTPWKPH